MSWSEPDTLSSIPERFEQQVRCRADHPAVGDLSYARLGGLVDRYAGGLREHAEPGARVGLLLRQDVPVLAAVLGALKCGLTVVTLNPGEPPARLAEMRAAAGPDLLVTDRSLEGQAWAGGFVPADTVLVEGLADHAPLDRPGPELEPEQLAFLVCTSGSSGRPKVVMQTHRNMLHNVLRYTNGLGIEPDDRIAWLASLSGGQGLATVLTALLNGATLCPFPIAERGVTGLAAWLRDNRVSVFDTIPSVLRNFARTLRDERVGGVRLVRIASEGALRSDYEAFVRHFGADSALASVLASSEAGIIAQTTLVPGQELAEGRLPVGRPAEGLEVLLLGEDGAPVGDGQIGEIVLRGRYLSPGYWGDERLTAARFTADGDARRFRTGDLGRRDGAGLLTVTGRADKMVKVRGHRLQLEEVETALSSREEIAAVAVTADETARGDTRLTAYVVPSQGTTVDDRTLRMSLRDVLPGYAIPARIVAIDELPLTPHGKLDHERLSELGPQSGDEGPPPVGVSETEELVIGLWSRAFERTVDGLEPFLDLGGDSLTAAVIAAGVHELFGVELDLRVFVANPTAATVSALIEQRRSEGRPDESPPLRRVSRTGPLSASQVRMWQPREARDPRWNVAVPFAITGPLDVDVLQRSVTELVRRHEILRTNFTSRGDHHYAVVHPAPPFHLELVDLRGESDPDARSQELLDVETQRPFHLESGPLLRLLLIRFSDQEHRLLRITHHIIHDAVSWQILFGELATVYTALLADRPAGLGDPPEIQYLDYAVWEGEWAHPGSPRFRAEVDWWQRELDGAPAPVRLPFQRAQAAADQPLGTGVIRWGIPPRDGATLDRLGRESGATYYMTRLAAFAALLAIEGEADELVIGTPASMRTRLELQSMIGPLINFANVRLCFGEDPSYRRLLAEVRRAVVEISPHVAAPWEELRPELVRRQADIPRVSATFHSWAGPSTMRFAGLQLEPLPRQCGLTWVFRLGVNRHHEADRCWTEFDTRAHDPAALRGFLGRLGAFIAAICAEPDRSLRDLHGAASLIWADSPAALRA